MLAKVNVDEEQFIAAQFQVRSIPTVYAMFQGQPVADLTPARSESQLRQALDQLARAAAGPGRRRAPRAGYHAADRHGRGSAGRRRRRTRRWAFSRRSSRSRADSAAAQSGLDPRVDRRRAGWRRPPKCSPRSIPELAARPCARAGQVGTRARCSMRPTDASLRLARGSRRAIRATWSPPSRLPNGLICQRRSRWRGGELLLDDGGA